MIHRIALTLYGVGLALLFGVVFSAQILGFLSIYTPLSAAGMTALVTVGAGYAFFRHDQGWLRFESSPIQEKSVLAWTTGAVVFALLAGFFLLRMALYPETTLGENIPSDLINYHFTKTIELVRTGSMWDLGITYGQYPIGYESLNALLLALTGSVRYIGFTQALTVLLFFLAVYLLLRRYTPLPTGLSLLLALGLCFFPALYSQLLLIGKNDLLLTTALLMAILHAPLRDATWHPYGLAFASMVCIATKPNGALILFFLWGLVLWRAWHNRLSWAQLAFLLALMFPCGLWVLRNVAVMGRVYSPEITSFFSGSIAARLNDPLLYASGAESFWLITLAVMVVASGTLLIVLRRWWVGALVLVMWGTFMLTPLSAFHTPQSRVLHVEWRYTTHLFVYLYVLLLALIAPLLLTVYAWVNAHLARVAAALLIVMSLGLAWVLDLPEMLALDPTRAHALISPLPEPSGYEFVHENIHDAVIYYDGAEQFYLYGGNFSNTLTHGRFYPLGMPELLAPPEPDYAFFHRHAHLTEMDFSRLDATYEWEIMYQDDWTVVYRRSDTR